MIGGLVAVELVKWRMRIETRSKRPVRASAGGWNCDRPRRLLSQRAARQYLRNPTSLPVGVDFGDGIPRHPTQLYEVAFMLVLAAALVAMRKRFTRVGDQFRFFMISYMSFRLIVDFIKPEARVALGLSVIQWGCVATLVYYAFAKRGPLKG